ncbi:MAG: DNA mismatch repair endonuclease MutL [Chitinophagales bacterium]
MPDIIQLLPDNIANQIAAGEVIQRPASAVKELLENAVDAGATEIRLIVQDAGKSLIQVVDNGKGMSETDARMAFERHATSKIRDIEDLFRIRTMGFRGEALASIAAVSQVIIKTRRQEDGMGTLMEIENSMVSRQEPVAFEEGTSIAMKNLFFNVPARRNFLKSNAAEMRHIIEEFIRIALSFPGVFFSLNNHGQEIFHLDKGSLKQRIVQILGSQLNAKLVSVQEKTDYMNIYGFVGKPESAKKTRGDQYFFVNNRYIRSAYLNHAVMSAFHEMIPSDSFPLYVLFIDLDPSQLDINVHPTKQEIKFEDEKIVYSFVLAAVKHALAQFSITPTLDFDLDPEIQKLDAVNKPITEEIQAQVASSSLYRTFTQKNQAHFIEPSQQSELHHWKRDFHSLERERLPAKVDAMGPILDHEHLFQPELTWRILEDQPLAQLLKTYIIASTNQGLILLHQQSAHERILYERYLSAAAGKKIPSQRSLFPATLDLSYPDAVLMADLIPDLRELGFQIEPFGKESFVIQGTPADIPSGNERQAIENILEQFKHFSSDKNLSKRERLVRTLARQNAIKSGVALSEKEMHGLVEDLMACGQSNMTANGFPVYLELKKDYLEKLFGR